MPDIYQQQGTVHLHCDGRVVCETPMTKISAPEDLASMLCAKSAMAEIMTATHKDSDTQDKIEHLVVGVAVAAL